MNRRKKLTQAFKKKRKAANAKLSSTTKTPYIAKADRDPNTKNNNDTIKEQP